MERECVMADEYPKVVARLPEEAGRCVSMLQWGGRIMIACEYRLYELIEDDLREIEFRVSDAREPTHGTD